MCLIWTQLRIHVIQIPTKVRAQRITQNIDGVNRLFSNVVGRGRNGGVVLDCPQRNLFGTVAKIAEIIDYKIPEGRTEEDDRDYIVTSIVLSDDVIAKAVIVNIDNDALWAKIPASLKEGVNLGSSPSNSQVQQELARRLSDKTEIYFPFNAEFANYTERWSAASAPDIAIVVVPATAQDVATTVKVANAIGVPFFAVNKGHGSTITQRNVKHGIEINMRSLANIDIAADGKSASMGGGVFVEEIIQTLDAKGKSTATGACACVGGMGPALGGGFGRYMGYYGLAADQIIDLDVVLADGSLIKVSATSNSDLYWGMRGAGHNFGIVTQFNYKIYNRPTSTWYYSLMFFTNDKLERLFELVNNLVDNGNQPKELTGYALYLMNPEISKTEPAILWSIYYSGTAAQAQPYLAPFVKLGPVIAVNDTVSYPDLFNAVGSGVDSPVCQNGGSAALFPTGLKTYNATANRAVMDLFKKMVTEQPAFNNSIVQFENYPVQKMQSIDAASTAYPHRNDNLLASWSMIYSPSAALDALVPQYGHQARALFDAGEPQRPLNTYVNYAYGDETVEQLYGYEPWRMQRLKDLKQKYDPQNRFRFYNPIEWKGMIFVAKLLPAAREFLWFAISYLFLCFAYAVTQVASAPASGSCPSELHPSYPAPSLAPGYKAQLIFRNLTKPRGIIVDGNGHLLVVQQQVGISSLSIVDQGNGCVKVSQNTSVIQNANLTHGIALSNDGKTLYASSAEAVFSWPYDSGKSTVSGTGTNVVDITHTSDGDHITRTLLMAKKQQNTLIVSRGSESNVDFNSLDLSTGHCQIKSFPVQDGKATQNFNTTGKLLGWGLRNSVGVAEHPTTGGIYSVDMGMDYATRDGKDISQNNPGDEMNYHGIIGHANDLNQGLNHGYPYCHTAWDVAAIPNHGDLVVGNQFLVGDVNDTFVANDTLNDAVCVHERAGPVLALPPHNAPIDLKFAADGSEAYISFHGSWDRNGSTGYKVSKVDFANGSPVKAPSQSKSAIIDVMSNPDVSICGQIVPYVWNKLCFRPAGLAFNKNGILFMSSDETGEIWAITKVK
ncbi:MAG: hypothetical protein Q9218_006750 [Villophora microphyllina]